jgi:TolB-like protein/Flp pilus assembly protein TadD
MLLAQHPNQVITRRQFFETVWQERVVNDEALSRAISLLRTALQDNAQAPTFIQTVPGIGYRLVAAVDIVRSRAGAASSSGDFSAKSIAVLPFVNMSEDAGNEYFSDGVSEEILNVLAQIDGFRIVGRTSSFAFKNRNEDLRKIGQALDASHVLEGSVRKADNRVRVTAQLIKVSDGYHEWSGSFDRNFEDIFAVQDEIATAVAAALTTRLLENFEKSRETGPEAYSRYLQGLFLVRSGTTDGVRKALDLFRQVVDLDPDYAPAWVGLTDSYWYLISYGAIENRHDAIQAAREANERALELDDRLAEAHVSRAVLCAGFDHDWSAARQALGRARTLAPGNTRILAQSGNLASCVGDLESSVEQLERVVMLDPLYTTGHIWLSVSLLGLGRLDQARDVLLQAINLNPARSVSHMLLSKILLIRGDLEASLEEAQLEPDGFWREYVTALILHSLGWKEQADRVFQAIIREHSDIAPFQIGEIHAWRGENAKAFEWLDRARAERDNGLTELFASPFLAGLHGDPRWAAFMKKMGHRWPFQ